MSLVGAAGGEEEDVPGAVEVRQRLLLVAGPEVPALGAETRGERLEGRHPFSVPGRGRGPARDARRGSIAFSIVAPPPSCRRFPRGRSRRRRRSGAASRTGPARAGSAPCPRPAAARRPVRRRPLRSPDSRRRNPACAGRARPRPGRPAHTGGGGSCARAARACRAPPGRRAHGRASCGRAGCRTSPAGSSRAAGERPGGGCLACAGA